MCKWSNFIDVTGAIADSIGKNNMTLGYDEELIIYYLQSVCVCVIFDDGKETLLCRPVRTAELMELTGRCRSTVHNKLMRMTAKGIVRWTPQGWILEGDDSTQLSPNSRPPMPRLVTCFDRHKIEKTVDDFVERRSQRDAAQTPPLF